MSFSSRIGDRFSRVWGLGTYENEMSRGHKIAPVSLFERVLFGSTRLLNRLHRRFWLGVLGAEGFKGSGFRIGI